MANSSDMQAEKVGFLRSGADSKGMPFKESDVGNIDENVVSGLKGEMWRLSNDKADNFARQDHTHGHPGLALIGTTFFFQKQ